MKMLKGVIAIMLLMISVHTAWSQVPSNDNCSNAVALTPNASGISGTVYNASTQNGETTNLPCTNGNTDHSVWYSFVANATHMYVQVYKTGLAGNGNNYSPSKWAVVAFNTSSCVPASNTEISCSNGNTQGNGDDIMELDLNNLTVNNTYKVEVAYKPGNGEGQPNFIISTGNNFSTSCGACSSPCGAACQLATVPSSTTDVTNNCSAHNLVPYLEGNMSTTKTFTFTATNSIMNFGVVINSTCSGSNTSSFNWTLYNSSCTVLQSGNASSKSFTGLTVGQSYTFSYTLTVPQDCYHTAYYPYVYPNQTLPVELSSFNSTQQNNTVELNWVTESELNNRSFTIQRSSDAVNFHDIATIDGAGTSNVRHSYSYTDSLPLVGTLYYRLKQSDYFVNSVGAVLENDGTNDSKLKTDDGNDDDVTSINFSHVVSVDFQPDQTYQVNTTSSALEINLFQAKQSMVLIFDERGIVIYRTIVNGPAALHVPLLNKSGIWYACLIDGNHKELMKAF